MYRLLTHCIYTLSYFFQWLSTLVPCLCLQKSFLCDFSWLVSETVLLMGRHIFNGITDKIYHYAYTKVILDTIMTEDDKIINEPNIYQCEYMTTLFNREKQILRPYSNHTPKTRCMYTPFKGFVGSNFGLAHRQCHATTHKLLNNSKYSINLYSPEIHTWVIVRINAHLGTEQKETKY